MAQNGDNPPPRDPPDPNMVAWDRLHTFLGQMTDTQRIIGAALEDRDRGGAPPQGDNRATKEVKEFMKNVPSFERGKDRWADFSRLFQLNRTLYGVNDHWAKLGLWSAISGRSSRLVIASMYPGQDPYDDMTFAEYLQQMGNKFTPAAESMQMKSEYKSRVQAKNEDVQNYITEKYELFKVAYPDVENLSDFYVETTKGIANKYVRNNLWGLRATSVENYSESAVYWVQVERQRIAFGDSDSTSMDGLIPVTKVALGKKTDKVEPMEIDHLQRGMSKVTIQDGEITEDEEVGDDCECMALHERGFRGPCYYCMRKGHMIRNCPRKSAGLPRVRDPNKMQKPSNQVTGTKPKWNPSNKTQQKGFTPQRYKRVNQLEESQDAQEGAEVTEDEDEETEVTFLEELTL